MYWCGIDAGGTKTEGKVTNETGAVAGFLAGGTNLNGNSVGEVEAALKQAVDEIERLCGGMEHCGAVCAGISGISNQAAVQMWRVEFDKRGFAGKLLLVGDHETALYGAHGKAEGMILIAGTGSICFGKNGSGVEHRAGGYGYLIDDDGSGYDLGRELLRAVVREHDGRGEKTVMRELLFETLGCSSVADVTAFVYRKDRDKKEIADMARLVMKAAELGDPVAEKILDQAADRLTDMAAAVADRLGLEKGELALGGSVLLKTDLLRKRLEERLKERYGERLVREPIAGAADGALRMAKEAVGSPFGRIGKETGV